jgi:hypothetical protein
LELSTGGLAWSSLAMVAGLVCVGSFGIMFVLLTWALEVTSYCAADADGDWYARAELAAKPHLAALLPYLGQPVRADGGAASAAEDGAALPVLATAPWLAVAGLYSAFRGWSYRDLVAAGPRLAAALWRARGAAPSS